MAGPSPCSDPLHGVVTPQLRQAQTLVNPLGFLYFLCALYFLVKPSGLIFFMTTFVLFHIHSFSARSLPLFLYLILCLTLFLLVCWASVGDNTHAWIIHLVYSHTPGINFFCIVSAAKVNAILIVYFSFSVDIHKSEHIYPYNCDRKKEFIKKGISKYLTLLLFHFFMYAYIILVCHYDSCLIWYYCPLYVQVSLSLSAAKIAHVWSLSLLYFWWSRAKADLHPGTISDLNVSFRRTYSMALLVRPAEDPRQLKLFLVYKYSTLFHLIYLTLIIHSAKTPWGLWMS